MKSLKQTYCILASCISHLLLLAALCFYFSPQIPGQPLQTQWLPSYVYTPSLPTLKQPLRNTVPRHTPQHQAIALTKLTHHRIRKANIKHATMRTAQPQANKKAHDNMLFRLHQLIAERQTYPEVALLSHQAGTVAIGFLLHPDGRITKIHIRKSSGIASLDQAALTTLSAISPIANMPAHLNKPEYFLINIVFEL